MPNVGGDLSLRIALSLSEVPQGSPFPVSPSKLMPSPELKLDYRDCLKISVSMAGAGVEGELTQEVKK